MRVRSLICNLIFLCLLEVTPESSQNVGANGILTMCQSSLTCDFHLGVPFEAHKASAPMAFKQCAHLLGRVTCIRLYLRKLTKRWRHWYSRNSWHAGDHLDLGCHVASCDFQD